MPNPRRKAGRLRDRARFGSASAVDRWNRGVGRIVCHACVLVGVLLFGTRGALAAPAFFGLGDLPGGASSSAARGLSAHALSVVGESDGVSGTEAFVWTKTAGLVGLGDLPGGGFFSQSFAISDDGSTVVGFGLGAVGLEAFRWTSGAGMVGLGDLAGGSFSSIARAVSQDGTIVVGQGTSTASGFGTEAFRWSTGGGLAGLGDLPGGIFNSQALGVSDDGLTVVGRGTSASGNEAFRWTLAGGMAGLGDLPGGAFDSEARDVSADGGTIVGFGNNGLGVEAFRWTSGEGMVGLGDLPGGNFSSLANAISADGKTIVGSGSGTSGAVAMVWNAVDGMRDLKAVLTGLGLDLNGWTLVNATGVSADGRVIVGLGTNPAGNLEAWMAVLPGEVPPDPDRFLTFFNAVSPTHQESSVTAGAYHLAIDPLGGKTRLEDWLAANGFDPQDPDASAEAVAIYVNEADLGFGRHMYVRTELDGRVASFVKNHSDDTPVPDPVDGASDEKISNAHLGLNLIATVAMEYGPPPSDPGGTFYTRFYAFDGNGDRILSANLDGRGEKFLPGVCNVCHGGNPRPLLADGRYPDEGDTGAGFLPWDLDTLAFSDALFPTAPLYDRANQEAAFKIFNQAVLQTNPTAAAREVIEGWYGGPGLPDATFDGSVVPPGWSGHEDAYRQLLAPNCRACHVMRNPAVAFQTYGEFVALRDHEDHLVFDRALMPLAVRTFTRFWKDVSVLDPALVDLLGVIEAARRPGPQSAFVFAGPDRSGTVGVGETLDATASSFVSSFAWSIQSAPSGSAAVLSDPTSPTPDFTPDLPGEYVFRLLDPDRPTVSDLMTLTATTDGGIVGVDFPTGVLPIYTSTCRSCHVGGVVIGGRLAPDFDGDATIVDSPAYREAVYRSLTARSSVIDPAESLLLRKATGNAGHGGGAPLLFGSPPYALILDWIAEGAVRTTTPGYRKRDGSVVNPILSYTPVPFSIGGPHPYAGRDLEPGADLAGGDLGFAFLNEADLSGVDLSNADLTSTELSRATLRSANLTGALLTGAFLVEVDLTDATGLVPSQVESAASLLGVLLVGLDLTGIQLGGRSLSFAVLDFTKLAGADLRNASLSSASLVGADLTGADLTNAGLDQVDLSNAIGLTTLQLESALFSGGLGLVGLDLAGLDLSGRSLTFSDLSGSNLSGADLGGTNLASTNLDGADLRGANLANASNLGLTRGSALYDLSTDFTGTGFDPVAAGWTLLAPPSVPLVGPLGMVVLTVLLGGASRRARGIRRT